MPIPDRTDPDVNDLWDQFHSRVNMTSGELRTWLLTQGSDGDAFPREPDRSMPEPGKAILAVLGKRKVDLVGGDVEVMGETVAQIDDLLAARPAVDVTDEEWRHSLMDLGHDPLRDR